MNCYKCRQHFVLFYLLPDPKNTNEKVWACEGCAEQSPAFCSKHKEAHKGFGDGSTACLKCVEELVEKRRQDAFLIWGSILSAVPGEEVDNLKDAFYAETSETHIGDGEEVAALRFIARKAACKKRSLDDVLAEIRSSSSVKSILFTDNRL